MLKNRLIKFVFKSKGRIVGKFHKYYRRTILPNEKRFSSFKDMYKNQRIFVIGNGPSLNRMDLTRLKNEITIGCNGIFLKFDDMGFATTFYTVEDNLVAEDRQKVINSLDNTIKILPYDLRYCLRPDNHTIFVNFVRNYPGFPRFSFDCDSIIYWGGTVTYFNIQLACHLGAREIHLIGVDHSYQIPQKDIFVDKTVIQSNSRDQNHFHPDYFGPGYRYHDPKTDRMEKAYKKAAAALTAKGIGIFNSGVGGKLEIFDRRDFDGIFKANNR